MGDIGKLLDTSRTGVDLPSKPAPVMVLPKIDLRRSPSVSENPNTGIPTTEW